ncbi:hypothetical protein E4H04_12795 [Candidatus Bathyarchaeota archaeon]|nr:MAG: hypothetical protein E4H04_12795 [Candidatus Bathyarchaeota archaeon]
MASLSKIVNTIKEIELKSDEVELLEDCESVTNIIIGQVLEMIQDPEMREDIQWLQRQHSKPNAKRWRNIVELTERLFNEAGGSKRIRRYHEIEAPCREVSLEEINSIDDPEVKETVLKIRHIHDNMLIRMTRTITKTYYE